MKAVYRRSMVLKRPEIIIENLTKYSGGIRHSDKLLGLTRGRKSMNALIIKKRMQKLVESNQ